MKSADSVDGPFILCERYHSQPKVEYLKCSLRVIRGSTVLKKRETVRARLHYDFYFLLIHHYMDVS